MARYSSSYNPTDDGLTQFSKSWQDGAKYQQLQGTAGTTNAGIDSQFAALSQGGSATKTVADDGDGWMLLKQDKTSTSDERVDEYKRTAAEWQAAGYDVRVQDHNPEFGLDRNSEIAVRKTRGDDSPEEAPAEPILESDQVKQARERVKNYERNILDGTTSKAIYGNAKFDPSNLNLYNSNSGYLDKYQFNPGGVNDDKPIEADYQPDTFSGSDVSAYETEAPPKQAANAFLQSQKNKAIKDYNIQPVGL